MTGVVPRSQAHQDIQKPTRADCSVALHFNTTNHSARAGFSNLVRPTALLNHLPSEQVLFERSGLLHVARFVDV